jgi:hypothetical protein
MSKDSNDKQSYLDNGIRVGAYHQEIMNGISKEQIEQTNNLSDAIDSTEELLLSLGYKLPDRTKSTPSQSVKLRPDVSASGWEEILAEAKKSTPEHVDFSLLLTEREISTVLKKHSSIGSELNWFSSLDRFDFALSIVTGIIAGIIDVLLVGIPAHPGFLGGQRSEGGWLSNLVKEKTGNLFPKDKVDELEKAYGVSFDPSTNSKLQEHVAGLGPRTHRFQSPGHDPLMGFIFGVRDILTGDFTAISKDGFLIMQQVADPFLQGEHLFIRILEALKIQFGHLASDVATPSGLPAPLMPLLMFLQFGKIGKNSYTIGEVARQIYRSGYDFRHFMASSLPVMITEIIIRLGYFIRSLQTGKSLSESVPSASSLKLKRQLLIAHSVATLINAGKVYVTQNPMAISWAQILVFLRYVMPEVAFLLYGKDAAISKMVEEEILKDYHRINNGIGVFLKTQADFVLVV